MGLLRDVKVLAASYLVKAGARLLAGELPRPRHDFGRYESEAQAADPSEAQGEDEVYEAFVPSEALAMIDVYEHASVGSEEESVLVGSLRDRIAKAKVGV